MSVIETEMAAAKDKVKDALKDALPDAGRLKNRLPVNIRRPGDLIPGLGGEERPETETDEKKDKEEQKPDPRNLLKKLF